MPRLDIRIRTKLPAKLFYNKEGTNIKKKTIISELSLSGALINILYHEPKDIITIKPKLPKNDNIYLIGEVIRKFNEKVAVKFYFSNEYTKAKLWEYIKKKLSNTNECPYCCFKNNLEAEYCGNCNWLLNFDDRDYLGKHDRETFIARIQNLSGKLTIKQMQRVLNFTDTELLKERGEILHEEFVNTAKSMQKIFVPIRRVNNTDMNRVKLLKEERRGKFCFESIVSRDPKMVHILRLIAQVANTDANILIQGESGTGKELIAHALHYNSRRKDNPFVPVNCGAIPETLLESELFGHVQGAFTGAISDKIGFFEYGDGGTIFLDEISEITLFMQVKLLRILQTGEYSRVGSTEIRQCKARILASANKDLRKLVEEGRFREDLYYRLNVLEIALPPLRDRKSDIPILIQHFLKIFSAKYGKENLRLSRETETLLLDYDFPGNIRELENIIQRAVILAKGEYIDVHYLPKTLYKSEAAFTYKETSTFKVAKQHVVEQFERKYIIDQEFPMQAIKI